MPKHLARVINPYKCNEAGEMLPVVSMTNTTLARCFDKLSMTILLLYQHARCFDFSYAPWLEAPRA
jgi:hypothetical protein